VTGPRRFGPEDLGTDRSDELDDARTAAAWLDEAADVPDVSPSAGFGDRVMAALEGEPAPRPAGFLAPVRRLGLLGGFAASVRQAWTALGGSGRPVLARASALAYVLVVVIAGTSLAGVATVGLAGVLGVFDARPTQSAPPQTPGPTDPPARTELPTPHSAPPTAGQTDEPSASPDESDDHEGSGEPESSDDHGGDSSGSDSSDSGSGDSSSGSNDSGSDDSSSGSSDSGSDDSSSGSESEETGTPKPTETPH
jgi:uncharacterized membrane protein YgcG